MLKLVRTPLSQVVADGSFDPLFVRGYGIADALGASQAAPPAPGEINADGAVDIVDFLTLPAHWS